jgi:hypothetical protein
VAPHIFLGDHELNKIDSALYQEALMEILAFMVLWFMRRKYLNDPTLFLHFCDYPPFEEDLDFI